ncbi:MAG TPA: response regulator transcription factor [Chitinophagaceae bacterium]|nr:response regulator transcription factor [Chitinophagaceae bacterium]
MKYTVFIVEDNLLAAESLTILLGEFASLQIVGSSTTKDDAVNKINYLQPNIIFIDINLGHNSGFEVLDACVGKYQYVIFTTAYEEFALKSYDYNATHYLLKPITKSQLEIAIQKIATGRNEMSLQDEVASSEISNASSDSFYYYEKKQWKSMNFSEVLYIKGESSYSTIHAKDKHVKLSKNLKNMFELFAASMMFVRIHKSYIVNINYVSSIVKGIKPKVILTNGIELPITLKGKERVFNQLGLKRSLN